MAAPRQQPRFTWATQRGEPALLIVDEPKAALDPAERVRFLFLLSGVGESSVVPLSTHLVENVSAPCTRMAIIDPCLPLDWEEREDDDNDNIEGVKIRSRGRTTRACATAARATASALASGATRSSDHSACSRASVRASFPVTASRAANAGSVSSDANRTFYGHTSWKVCRKTRVAMPFETGGRTSKRTER